MQFKNNFQKLNYVVILIKEFGFIIIKNVLIKILKKFIGKNFEKIYW